ncbi:4-galactosyl-N-acetylglucosaminide 3-alpha-L-fucosyltransferase FUT6-like [Hydractinia symbiolongicarpus]|uniref:4-galactosyl-N-acetylglucosaminide 3-alpha-L-fucosyltransferase FUT6-like n=1 Tax=Hydractinia symbiolongicarpus TaxID=13093 RepID=UPI00254BCB99|nr:4-galactosyl-N-acetylglucosaminide 3-alpha-L-fucosyltransferase FUT6-like [Hydractinia symbiolongicarpus]
MNRRKVNFLLVVFVVSVTLHIYFDRVTDVFNYLKDEICFEWKEKFPTEFTQVASTSSKESTLVLFYTKCFSDKCVPHYHTSYEYNPKCNCNFKRFELIYNPDRFLESDIVIFHGRNMPCLRTLRKLHKQRKPNQLWAYFIMENPTYHTKLKSFEKYFNMWISYRLTSDVYVPYRRHFRLNSASAIPKLNYALNKTRQVAWLVSSCGKLREELAHKLIKYGIKIEVVGKCAKHFKFQLQCNKHDCKEELKSFKFYFAAENTLCDDYVTEKYWRKGFDYNAIPIVFGGANYSNPKLVIPGSFIDAMSFNSVKDLAEYIKEVDNDDDKFNSYFEWKKYWGFEHPNGCDPFYQQLCERMHTRRDRTLSSYINHDECKAKTIFFKSWINR